MNDIGPWGQFLIVKGPKLCVCVWGGRWSYLMVKARLVSAGIADGCLTGNILGASDGNPTMALSPVDAVALPRK